MKTTAAPPQVIDDQVFDFIVAYICQHGYSPSIPEIKTELSVVPSHNTAYRALERLEEAGLIKGGDRDANGRRPARALSVTAAGWARYAQSLPPTPAPEAQTPPAHSPLTTHSPLAALRALYAMRALATAGECSWPMPVRAALLALIAEGSEELENSPAPRPALNVQTFGSLALGSLDEEAGD